MTTVADGLYQYGGVPVGLGVADMSMFAIKNPGGSDGTVWAKQSIIRFVDGSNGNDSNTGLTPLRAKATIQNAIDSLPDAYGGIVYVYPKALVALSSDPTSYVETVTISKDKPGTSIIGVGTGRTMGGLPQIRIGSGSTAMITIKAPGCSIRNLGINGAGSTGGGINAIEDAAGTVATCFGLSVVNCHFKNCKGSAAASTGGAVNIDSAWNTLIENCLFQNNRCGIRYAASKTDSEDITIRGCTFTANANTTVDADIYIAGNVQSVSIDNCIFAVVDVPAYATSPDAARYIKCAGNAEGLISACKFACTGKTFGATGDAVIAPTTIRMSGNWQENGLIART